MDLIGMLYGWVTEQIANNDIFNGVIGGSIFVSLMYILRNFPKYLWMGYLRNFTVETEILSTTEAYSWISGYLSSLEYTESCRRLRVERCRVFEGHFDILVTLGQGLHFFFIGGSLVFVRVSLDSERSQMQVVEKYMVRTLGRSQNVVRDLIERSKDSIYLKNKIPVYRWRRYWDLAIQREGRPMNTVILDNGIKDDMIGDIGRFFSSEEWYNKRGISWRRGYLFSGLPGTGKSSLALALAGHFRKPLYVLNMGNVSSDSELENAFSSCSGILLIEDVDACSRDRSKELRKISRQSAPTEEVESVSLSGFLNQLDGCFSPQGQVVIMTTNYPEDLDDAMLRPGRVDYRLDLGYLDCFSAEGMIYNFYDEHVNIKINEINDVTPAFLQGILQNYPDNVKGLRDCLIGDSHFKIG